MFPVGARTMLKQTEFIKFFCNFVIDQIEDEMGSACSTYGSEKKFIQNFNLET
jgi:hypothetical protein